MRTRFNILALVGFVGSCAVAPSRLSGVAKTSFQAGTCDSTAMRGERPFAEQEVNALAGTYDLVLIVTTRASSTVLEHRGRLQLWVQDSARSDRSIFGSRAPSPDFKRPLAASFVVAPPDTAAWWRRMASTDLDRPGGVWMRGRLWLGDYGVMDGTGEMLWVSHVSPTGFRGRWESNLGIAVVIDQKTDKPLPNPGGYYCAFRRAV